MIDRAVGIIMAESRCDADQAFAMLSRASNNRNIKLRDLATEIVTQVGGRPPPHSANLAWRCRRPTPPTPASSPKPLPASGLEKFPEPAELVTETAGVKAELR